MIEKRSPHIYLAHQYWENFLNPHNNVIDATCGNGHDTLFLAKHMLFPPKKGKIFCYDIQEDSIKNTKKLLKEHLTSEQLKNIELLHQSHETFSHNCPIDLVIYNLGYLPGSDKKITTRTTTTIHSIRSAKELLSDSGAICITCYPGHEEGSKEEEAILHEVKAFSPHEWFICFHQWPNRKKAPSLLWIEKI